MGGELLPFVPVALAKIYVGISTFRRGPKSYLKGMIKAHPRRRFSKSSLFRVDIWLEERVNYPTDDFNSHPYIDSVVPGFRVKNHSHEFWTSQMAGTSSSRFVSCFPPIAIDHGGRFIPISGGLVLKNGTIAKSATTRHWRVSPSPSDDV